MESSDNSSSQQVVIGDQLRKARESKKLTHADILKATRIPTATIIALESDDYSSLPSSYARSFLIQYSEFLGVNASESVNILRTSEVVIDLSDHSYLQRSQERIRKKGEKASKARHRKRHGNGLGQLALWQWASNIISLPVGILLVSAMTIVIGVLAYLKYLPGEAGPAKPMENPVDQANDQVQGNLAGSAPSSGSGLETSASTEAPHVFDPLFIDNVLRSSSRHWNSIEPFTGFSYGNAQREDSTSSTEAAQELDTSGLPGGETSPPPKAMIVEEAEE